MNYPLQAMMRLGVVPAGDVSDGQPVLRLERAAVHRAQRAE